MTPLVYFFLFITGLAVGSFLNVIIFRYRPGGRVLDPKIIGGPGNWKSRSHCMACEKQLSWRELIPLFSFAVQKGKCRGCGTRISFQYFWVELLSGLIFVFTPMFWAASLPLIQLPEYVSMFIALSVIWTLIFLIFIILSVIDIRHFVIPDSVNLTLAFLGVVLLLINNYFDRFDFAGGSFLGSSAALLGLRDNIWVNYLFASVLAMVFFGLIIVLSRGKGMGWGDFKMAGALGLIFGWPDVMIAVALAFIIGALAGILFLALGEKKMKDAVPFGPFLVAGAVLVFFFGRQIAEIYFKIISGLV